MKRYIPVKGDYVSLSFDPQAGHEKRGRRPALVVSRTEFNAQTGMAIVCPLTNTDRISTLHVPVSGDAGLTGFVMCEQVKSIDFGARSAKRLGAASAKVLDNTLEILDAVMF